MDSVTGGWVKEVPRADARLWSWGVGLQFAFTMETPTDVGKCAAIDGSQRSGGPMLNQLG